MWDMGEPNDFNGAELCVEMRDYLGGIYTLHKRFKETPYYFFTYI